MSDGPFLVVPFEVKSVKEESDEYIVEGIASMYGNIDSYRDIVVRGAFTEDLAERGNKRPILWQHNSREPVGRGEFTDSEVGLMVKACLPKEDTFVSGRVMPQIKSGSITGLSIGYRTLEYVDDRQNEIRKLTELKLYETSLVTFPANEEARIIAAKEFIESHEHKDHDSKAVPPFRNLPIAADDTSWSGSKAVSQAREATGSEEKPSAQYKTHFFYYDAENPDDFGSYKLPKAMLVDGEFKYVPRGLSAVVGAIAGARGGVDIPAADKEKIKTQLNRLYRDMDREEPFKSKGLTLLDVTTIKNMEPIDLERVLGDDTIILSRKAREHIAGVVSDKGMSGSDQGEGDGDLLEEFKRLNESIKEL